MTQRLHLLSGRELVDLELTVTRDGRALHCGPAHTLHRSDTTALRSSPPHIHAATQAAAI